MTKSLTAVRGIERFQPENNPSSLVYGLTVAFFHLMLKAISALILLFTFSFSVHAVKKGGTFKYCIRVSPETLNPITAHDNYSLLPLHWMSESLLARDPDTYAWVPMLAVKYDVSKDGRTYTFDLRHGVQFHDGVEMTADDVEFSIDVHRAASIYGVTGYTDGMRNFDRIEVLGKHRIRIHAKKPLFSNLQDLATLLIVPKHIYNTNEPTKRAATVIGTGPYRMKEYHQGMRMRLEANPEWWGRELPENKERFNFGEILVRFVQDENLRLDMLEKGDLDFTELSLDAALKRTKGTIWGDKVILEKAQHAGIYTTQQSLFLNLRSPLFAGVKTRKALQLLLNRKMLNDKFRSGLSPEATGPWHRLSEYSDPKIKPIAYDEKEAARLLKEDGWADPEHEGILHRVKDGVRQDLRFGMIFTLRDQEKFLTLYQGDLKRAGIDMQLRQTDWSLFMKLMDDHKYDAYIVGRGWPGVIDFNPKYEWSSAFTGPNQGNNIGYKNAEVDKILDKAELEFDRKKRIRLIQKAYRLIAEDQSQILMFSDDRAYYAHTSRVKVERPSLRYDLGIDNWWIE